jgi:anaerobic selenocysteine-containing dehydrogenase
MNGTTGERVRSICGLCDAGCGVVVTREGGRLRSIVGDPEDPFSRGHVCPKVVAHLDLQEDPDRLRHPVRRRGDEWDEISWDEALEEIGRRIADVQKRHGADALGFYYGNPIGHSYSTLMALLPVVRWLGTRNLYSANSTDAWPRMLASLLLYGNQALLPVPDLERARFLLVLGANPVVSNGSIMTAPGCKRRLEELRARGGRLVVVDPRRTETAAIADAHHFVRPGTDALLLLAMLDVVFREGLARLGPLEGLVDGMDDLRAAAAGYSADRVATAVGLPAATITGLAREFARSPTAACYGRMGVCTQEFGTLASCLVDALNIVTGNMDRPEGMMFATPAVDLAGFAERIGQTGTFGTRPSRATGLPDLDGEQPAAALAAEIESPGAGQIRAMLTLGANPVLSRPNGRRLDCAFSGLEFMASIDLYINETTRHAHVVLPALTPLECDRYPLLEPAMAVRNVARHVPPVLPRPPGAMEDWEILVRVVESVSRRRGVLGSIAGRVLRSAACAIGPRRALDVFLRLGPRRLSLARLEAVCGGVDLGPLEPRLAGLLRKAGRRVQLLPEPLRRDLRRLEQHLAAASRAPGDRLLLVSRRTRRTLNTWLHNSPRLARGGTCSLQMHPEDAARRGMTEGEAVVVASEVGRIEVPLEVTDEMMPGVVSLPFGWGHDRAGSRLSVAEQRPGASVNDVIDDRLVDALSGTSILGGVPVTVEPRTGG